MKKAPGDMIILHLGNTNHNYMMWFLRYGAQCTELFVILDHFLPFYPSKHLENKNFENMKKVPGDTIILHMPTINDNHMMYAS